MSVAAWLVAAMLLSAAPYWLVRVFRPRWHILGLVERFCEAIAGQSGEKTHGSEEDNRD